MRNYHSNYRAIITVPTPLTLESCKNSIFPDEFVLRYSSKGKIWTDDFVSADSPPAIKDNGTVNTNNSYSHYLVSSFENLVQPLQQSHFQPTGFCQHQWLKQPSCLHSMKISVLLHWDDVATEHEVVY